MYRRVLCLVVVFAAVLSAGVAQAASGLRAACADPAPGFARCLTLYSPYRTFADGPSGLGAPDLQAAYQLPSTAGANTVVGVSIAYDAPDLEADLNAYRRQYGLAECTTANGCFRKVNQQGADGPLPEPDPGWAAESTLDVSMISAACPSCRILVVEGNSNSFADLAATEDTAIRLGAKVVSNSYGGRENGQAMALAKSYNRTEATVVVSSGDLGFTAASFPAALSGVVAVGGTTLTRNPDVARGWTEAAWSYGGSGCSAYVAKPSWQRDTHCSKRTIADVSAAADDIAIHSTDLGGWTSVSGTSASAPFIAGLYGRVGKVASPAGLYRNPGAFFDVTEGSNDPAGDGSKCGGDYLCTAQPGYDAPTGVGTPKGLAGF